MSADEAHTLAASVISDPGNALDVLAREELGIDPKGMGGSPWAAAVSSFALFAGGAFLPLLPFLLWGKGVAVAASLAISAVAFFLVGAWITLLTGKNWLTSGGRQLLFGFAAAGLTYGIGHLIGVTIGG